MGYTGSRLCPRQLGRWGTSVLLSVARLSCWYWVFVSSLVVSCVSTDANETLHKGWRRGAGEALDDAFAEKVLGLRASCWAWGWSPDVVCSQIHKTSALPLILTYFTGIRNARQFGTNKTWNLLLTTTNSILYSQQLNDQFITVTLTNI